MSAQLDTPRDLTGLRVLTVDPLVTLHNLVPDGSEVMALVMLFLHEAGETILRSGVCQPGRAGGCPGGAWAFAVAGQDEV